MDPLLRRILDAPAGEERDRVLSSIVELDLLPLARAIVSGKLRTYSGRSDHSDREDVVSEAMMTLLERLRALSVRALRASTVSGAGAPEGPAAVRAVYRAGAGAVAEC